MASLADELTADLAEAISLTEQTFEWQGTEYPCTRTTAPTEGETGAGGQQFKVSERITVALSVFTDGSLPTYADFVDDEALQIQSVDTNIGHLVLWVVDPMFFQASASGE